MREKADKSQLRADEIWETDDDAKCTRSTRQLKIYLKVFPCDRERERKLQESLGFALSFSASVRPRKRERNRGAVGWKMTLLKATRAG